jgi:hypothetical protein
MTVIYTYRGNLTDSQIMNVPDSTTLPRIGEHIFFGFVPTATVKKITWFINSILDDDMRNRLSTQQINLLACTNIIVYIEFE